MRKLIRSGAADPRVRRRAESILQEYEVPERDTEGEADAFFDWTRNHLRFTKDPRGVELVTTAPGLLADSNFGDCDDYTVLLGSLNESVGIPYRVKVVRSHRDGPFRHVYGQALVNKHGEPARWKSYDPTNQNESAGWEVEHDGQETEPDSASDAFQELEFSPVLFNPNNEAMRAEQTGIDPWMSDPFDSPSVNGYVLAGDDVPIMEEASGLEGWLAIIGALNSLDEATSKPEDEKYYGEDDDEDLGLLLQPGKSFSDAKIAKGKEKTKEKALKYQKELEEERMQLMRESLAKMPPGDPNIAKLMSAYTGTSTGFEFPPWLPIAGAVGGGLLLLVILLR